MKPATTTPEGPEPKKAKTTKRRVRCVDGVQIDANDFDLIELIFAGIHPKPLALVMKTNPNGMDRQYECTPLIEIGDRDTGSRVRKLRVPRLFVSRLEHIGALDALESLEIDSLTLHNHPYEIVSLKCLRTLRIDCITNGLYALPDAIGRLTALEKLVLWDPVDVSFPVTIYHLRNLKDLVIIYDCNEHQETSLPNEIWGLAALETLRAKNSTMSSLPGALGNLTNLHILDLSHTSLESVPDEIGKLTGLEILNLWGTHSLRALPSTIGNLKKLKALVIPFPCDVDSNYLPKEANNLSELEYFDISCEFEGLGPDDRHNYAPILSKLLTTLGSVKNLSAICLPQNVYDCAESYQVLLETANRCPLLGCLVGGEFRVDEDVPHCKALMDSLGRNKVGYLEQLLPLLMRKCQSLPLSLWPCCLKWSTHAIPMLVEDNVYGLINHSSRNLYKISESDVLFHILLAKGVDLLLSDQDEERRLP